MGTISSSAKASSVETGVIIIGRNEGDRLKTCIQSVKDGGYKIVYVDSGSTDDSVPWAKSKGIEVTLVDPAKQFTAALARNTGFARLKELYPETTYVQFVDGDCEVTKDWISTAVNFLENSTGVAVVCGRRRERYPNASVYNMLCDIEWNTPVGEAGACGGDALYRVDVFEQVNGFNNSLIAGEEPELCVRIRSAGYQVWRLDAEMTLHDAAMSSFGQWWKRSQRAGYAYFLGASIHGRDQEKYNVRECLRIILWGGMVPLLTIFGLFFSPLAILILSVYPLQGLKLYFRGPRGGREGAIWALFIVIGKFAEFSGALKFFKDKLLSKKASLIEYK